MHFENGLAAGQVGRRHEDLAIEAAGPQQGWIEHVRSVGSGNHDHPGVRVKAIHFDENLVQGLFALVVAAAEAKASRATHGVDLIDKYDARRVTAGTSKEIAYATCADADEYLD